jgi:purine-binding chemotaxis protein CheW
MEAKYIVFHIGEEHMGVPISAVERILPAERVSRVPKSPKALAGMFHHAGHAIPVVDGALRFDLPAMTDPSHFLLIQTEFGRYALQVESVEQITEFKDSSFDSAEGWMASVEPGLVLGVGRQEDQLFLLLRPEAIVPSDLQKRFDRVAA